MAFNSNLSFSGRLLQYARKVALAWCGAHPPRTPRLQPRNLADCQVGPKSTPGPETKCSRGSSRRNCTQTRVRGAVPTLPAPPRLQPRNLANCQVGLKTMPGPETKMRPRMLAAQLHAKSRAWCGAHPPRTPRLQPRGPANCRTGTKRCRALGAACQ